MYRETTDSILDFCHSTTNKIDIKISEKPQKEQKNDKNVS